ncbi:MAG: hypothetical protein ACHQJ5_04690 [Vicinamibacteria bacterium]|jgi:Arc/MetJ family transcription regulator
MRTTLTVDDDLLAKLKQRARERDLPLKQVVNEALRAGLSEPGLRQQPYRVPTFDLKAREGIDLDKALALSAELEDREILRKLARGK